MVQRKCTKSDPGGTRNWLWVGSHPARSISRPTGCRSSDRLRPWRCVSSPVVSMTARVATNSIRSGWHDAWGWEGPDQPMDQPLGQSTASATSAWPAEAEIAKPAFSRYAPTFHCCPGTSPSDSRQISGKVTATTPPLEYSCRGPRQCLAEGRRPQGGRYGRPRPRVRPASCWRAKRWSAGLTALLVDLVFEVIRVGFLFAPARKQLNKS